MSAFMVSNVHIDALLTAGLQGDRLNGPLRWLWPRITPTDIEEFHASQAGSPWGPGSHDLYEARKHELTEETAGRVGAMLLAENRRSVDYRYNEEELEEPYVFQRLSRAPSPVEVLSALACLEYQSCEHPEWSTSEAYEFCDALRDRMIRKLPGYDSAPWEISDPEKFGGYDRSIPLSSLF